MPQISIGQIGTCGMCRFNKSPWRKKYGNQWEVYDFCNCTIKEGEEAKKMYYETCDKYQTLEDTEEETKQ